MKLSKKHNDIVIKALDNWENNNLLTKETASSLKQNIEVIKFNWKLLARYSFLISILCIVISIGAVFADKKLYDYLKLIFSQSHIVKFLSFLFFSIISYILVFLRKKKYPDKIFSN